MMFNFLKKISRMPSLRKKLNKTFFTFAGLAVIGLLLSGCNLFTSPDQRAANQPVEEPTLSAQSPASGRNENQPTESPSPTPSPTETLTSTPTPVISVVEFPDPVSFAPEILISGLDSPLFLTHAGDGSGRLFIIEKPGRIVILQKGERLEVPFLDIVKLVQFLKDQKIERLFLPFVGTGLSP